MLVDVTLKSVRNPILDVLAKINGGGVTQRLSTGMYISSHFNFGMEVLENLKHYPPFPLSSLCCYGVCDNPQQLIEKFPILVTSDRKFVVGFVSIKKEEQPAVGGWRWHRGPYIGDKDPQYEYLYDEPTITEVFTYHVYEVEEQ